MDEEKIKKAAKALMDEFMAALDAAPKSSGVVGIERAESVRKPEKCLFGAGFAGRVLENAPSRTGRYVLAEKKQW